MLPALATSVFLAVLPLSAVPAEAPPPAPAPTSTPAPTPPSWLKRITAGTPGKFPPPRPFNANYRITWSDLTAARVESQCVSDEKKNEIRTSVKAFTVGAARALYKLDATHLSIINRQTLRAIHLEQTEKQSKKQTAARVEFAADGATRWNRDLKKSEAEDTASRKPKRFAYPGLFDMEGTFLYLRSLPLANGDEQTILFMTSGNPYLATVKVVGRNRVKVSAGEFPAIECSLSLEKVTKQGSLEPRKGFKSAHVWFSDDADRVLLKAQSEIFIGSVNLELEKLEFPAPANPPRVPGK